ncbi:MAG: hypothetical protein GXP38_11015 [Chloroflexi bacterium]|nr:hypothetical protein [Chloroflexota bacterium]
MTTAPDQEFGAYLRIITRRWWLLILLPIVTSVVILALSSTSQDEYISYTRLQILPIDPTEVSLFTPTRFTTNSEQVQTIQDEFWEVFMSKAVARRTIADMKLNMTPEELIKRLETQQQFDFFTGSVRMPDPDLAQQTLSVHIQNALITYRTIQSKPAEISLSFLENQIEEQSSVLANAKAALEKFQLENELSDLSREVTAYQDLNRAMQNDRDQTTVEAERNDRLAMEFRRMAADNLAQAETLAATLPTTDTLTTDSTQILDRIESLRNLAYSQERSAEEYEAIAAGHRAAIVEYNRLLDARQQRLVYLLGLQKRYEELVNKVSRAQTTYNFLEDKANEARLKLNQGKNIGYLQIIDPANMPSAPVPKRTTQLLLVGILISLLVGVILAFILEAIEKSLDGRHSTTLPE